MRSYMKSFNKNKKDSTGTIFIVLSNMEVSTLKKYLPNSACIREMVKTRKKKKPDFMYIQL